ncbi:MAG: desulfoferrodoxin [Oscillospiraceae bacterium]|nr:desulfoferrodoxin [Oscillospiraceae bacterium]
MKFYENAEKKIIALRDDDEAELNGLTEIKPNTTDAAKEKHVPVVSREGQTVTVMVGSAAHPMTDAHYIGWIMLETKNGVERKDLAPADEPAAQFFADEDDEIVAAYAWCNLHGLWGTTN